MIDTDKAKTYLLRGDSLDEIRTAVDEWKNLVVIVSDVPAPKLTRGRKRTILELPKTAAATPPDPDHPFRVIDASDATTAKVRVTPGWILNGIMPTIAGAPLQPLTTTPPTPAPTLTLTQSGFVVLRTNWPNDIIPRASPISAQIVFEPGDVSVSYVPSVFATWTLAHIAIGTVEVVAGKIVHIQSFLRSNEVIERQVYGNGVDQVRYLVYPY